jgi:hypothetical protein
MRLNAKNFISLSLCGVTAAILIGTTLCATTYATTKSSYNKKVPNLAGTWQINRTKSDDPQDKLRKAMSGRGEGLHGGRSSGASGLPVGAGSPEGPPHGGVSDGGNSPSREDMELMRAMMEEGISAAEVLEVVQTDSEITVNETGSDRLVHTQTFYTDARKSEHETAQGIFETKARWQGNKFVVVTKERLGRITRIYELNPGGRQLYVTLKIEKERIPEAISIRSVYDKSL